MGRFAITFIFTVLLSSFAFGQSSPNFTTGEVPTATQWNSYFSSKQDYNGRINLQLGLQAPTTDGQNSLIQSGPKTAFDIYGPSAPSGWHVYDNIRSVIDIQPGAAVQNFNAFGSWIWNNVIWDPNNATRPAGVGHEAYCATIVAGAACFGINPAFTDSYDATALHSVAGIGAGGELDASIYNTGTQYTGFSFVIQGPAQPVGANIFQVLRNTATAARWTNGLSITDGAMVPGGAGTIYGATESSGTFIGSIPAIFSMFDGAGTKHNISVQAIPNATNNSGILFSDGVLNTLAFVFNTTGTGPQIYAVGGDTDININLIPKGTGNVTSSGAIIATSFTAGASAGQSGTVTVRDAAGTGTCTLIFTGGLKTGGTC